jgi:hypothetical protein
MKTCELCSQLFPAKIRVDGKVRNLQRRRYCIEIRKYFGSDR